MVALGQSLGPQAGIVIVTAEGDLDIVVRHELEDRLVLARDGHRHLILDLSAVTFLDSTALAVIIAQWKQLAATGGTLALAGARDRPARILQLTGLADRLPSYQTVAEATAALLAGGPSGE